MTKLVTLMTITAFISFAHASTNECIIEDTLTLVKGLNEFRYKEVRAPMFRFSPDINGTYLFGIKDSTLFLWVDTENDTTTHLCVYQAETPLKLTTNMFSVTFLEKTFLPAVSFYFCILLIIAAIVSFIVFLKLINNVTQCCTDTFCNNGKKVEMYFDDNFGVVDNDLYDLFIHKNIFSEEERAKLL